MTKGRVATPLRAAIVALYGLAMVLLPYAHRHLSLDAEPDLSAFVLPDGTLPLLCKSNAPGGNKASRSWTCDACRLTAAPGLVAPPAVQVSGSRLILLCKSDRSPDAPRFERFRPHLGQPRAPPGA